MKKIKKYSKIWWLMSRNSFTMVISQRLSVSIFLLGKILRFTFFFLFLYFLLTGTKSLAGYSSVQAIFIFLTFNVVDVVSQFFFREVYRFRPLIVKGDFDYVLSKPFSPLFRSLLGGADVIDLITIPPLLAALFWTGLKLNPDFTGVVFYIILLINGLIISAAFHIIVLSMAIITLEIDHSVMIYRDMLSLGKLPVDIYKEPLKSFLVYMMPVGVMVTFPVKALMGLATFWGIAGSLMLGMLFLFLSIKFWHFALKKYSSASS